MQRDRDAELLSRFVASHKLPESYLATARQWFVPLVEELRTAVVDQDMKVLGVVGTQGSGKSTLAALLEALLSQIGGLRVATLSLDDFYLTREQRQALAEQVHPLLATRGVPGTHDIPLALGTIENLLNHAGTTAVVRFDKARDDRKPEVQWDRIGSPVDLVILEGWCLKVKPQSEAELVAPVNALEQREDSDGRWRRYVNDALRKDYPPLFQLIDKLILLQAPSFDCVYHWRRRQEQKLSTAAGDRIMSDSHLERFVQHYERITQHSLSTLPKEADIVFKLNAEQNITARHDNPPE